MTMSLLQGRNLSISFKKSKERPNLKHNRREGDYPVNADQSRQHLNVAVKHSEPRAEYKAVFGDALDAYNAKQKRSDRKINDYYSHVYNSGGKQKPYEEFIIGLGNREDWENASIDEFAEGVEVVRKMVEKFREKNPQMHFINADVHGDESHPHAHIIAVPVGEGYKRGLSKQVSFSKALEGQGYRRTEFTEWRFDQLDALEDVANAHGIKRRIVGTNGYKDQEHYKKAMDDIRDKADAESRKVATMGVMQMGLVDKSKKELAEEEERIKQERELFEREKARWAQEKERQVQEGIQEGVRNANERAARAEAEAVEAKRSMAEMVNRIKTFVGELGTISEMYRKGIVNYIQHGRTGLAKGKNPNKVPATIRDVVGGLNPDAFRKAFDSMKDDGPEL